MLKINLRHELKRQDIFGFSKTKINPNSIQPEKVRTVFAMV